MDYIVDDYKFRALEEAVVKFALNIISLVARVSLDYKFGYKKLQILLKRLRNSPRS